MDFYNSLMFRAAKESDIEKMKRLHEQGWSLDINDRGWTLLHCAAKWGYLEVAEFLVKNNLDVNMRDKHGQTAVLIAARYGKKDIVELLVRSGADPSVYSLMTKWTVLHYASCNGWTRVTQIIVEKGSMDVNVKSVFGHTPLMLAIKNSEGSEDIAELLLAAGADCSGCDDGNMNVLHYACRAGLKKTVKRIFERGEADLDVKTSRGQTPLMLAIENGHEDIAELLLEAGAECSGFDDENKNVLHYACSTLRTTSMESLKKIVKHIIEKGETDLNAESIHKRTPLICAVQMQMKDIVKILILAGADVNRSPPLLKRSVLYIVVRRGWTSIAQLIVEKGDCDLNRTDEKRGLTLLHMVCKRCPQFSEMIKMLIRAGTDVNIKSKRNATALASYLRSPIHYPDIEIIRLLVQNGAYFGDVEYETLSRKPPLKELVLSDAKVCTQNLVNKFNHYSLPAVYEIPAFRAVLPPMDAITINSTENMPSKSTAEQEVAKFVDSEIKTKTTCDVLKARPIVLKLLCVDCLVNNKPTVKRSASPAMNIAKKRAVYFKPH